MARKTTQSIVSQMAKDELEKKKKKEEERKQKQNDLSQTAYNSIMQEVMKRRNTAANLNQTAKNAMNRMVMGGFNPVQEAPATNKLKKGIYNDLDSKIENEKRIINDQGRKKDAPEVLRAQETLKGLEKTKAETQKKLGGVQEPIYGKSKNNPFEPKVYYSPDSNDYIRKIQELNAGQAKSKKQTIPAVWKQDLKAIQHMRNTPDKAEGEEYIRWLQEGGEIGLYDKKTTNALIAQAGKSDDPLAQYMALTPEQKSGWLRNAGKDVRQLLTMRAAKEYNMAHPYTTDRDELLAQQGYYTGLRDEAQSTLDRMNGNIRIMYSPDGTEPVEIRGRSNPYYQQNPDAINEQFYDALVGKGEYQKRKAEFTDDPEGWEKADEFELQLTEAWDAYEQSRWSDAYRILTGKNNYAEMESQLGYANDQLNTIQGQLNLYNKYDEFMSGYTGAQRGSYDPGKDRGFDSLVDYGSRNNPNHRPSYRDPNTKDVHRVYSFINQGKEYKAYIQNANGGDENAAKIDAVYGKAALMLPEEIEIFNGYYNAGQYNEASAFLNGLSMALNDRYSKYEEIENREMARKYPVLSSFVTLLNEQMSGALAIPRTFAGFAGEKNVYDPNSAWYASTRYTEQTQDEIANMIGGEGGKFYLQGMNTLRNLTNAAMVAAAGVPAAGQAAAGLAMFATQIYQDQTYKYLKETNDYGKAVGMATLDAVLETMEEMLPYEAMLKGGGNILLDILKNSTSEALEELTGATVGEAIKGIVEGRQDWEKRRDQIFNEGGYADESGNWIELDRSDSNKALAQAQTQAWKEKGHQIIENTVAGFVGGGLGASYGAARNYLNTRSTGAQVNSKEGGFNTLLEAARGMNENSATRKLAEQLYAKQQKGKNISNYQAGQLAQTMYQESGQEIRDVIEGAMTRKVEGELIKEGASEEYAEKAAPIIAQTVTTGKNLRKADIRVIAKEDAGVILMESYMTGDRDAKEAIKQAGGEAAMNAQQAVRDVMGEKPAKAKRGPATEGLREFAPIAKQSDMESAEGPRHDNGLDAVVDGHIVSIKGRIGDNYTVVDENNEEHTVNKKDVQAADESLGLLMEYADRNRDIVDDDAFRELAVGLKSNQGMNLDDYLEQSTRAIINFRTGGTVRNSRIAAGTLNALKTVAQRQNDRWDEERIKKASKQRKATPGKGIVTYNGIQAGTDEWETMAKKAGPILGGQLRLIGEIGVRLGNEIEIVEREDRPDAFGWESPDTGKIFVNLAAENVKGQAGNRHVLTVTAHELTHWLEQNSPEEYKALRDFVFSTLRKNGTNIANRVIERIDNFQGLMKRDMTVNEAMAEIVADACDQVLTNEQVARQLEAESPNLYQKIKTFVKNFIETVRSYAGHIDTSKESRKMIKAGQETLDELARIWLGARQEAIELQIKENEEKEDRQIKLQVNSHLDDLNAMEPVAQVDSNVDLTKYYENGAKNERAAYLAWANEQAESFNRTAHREGIGNVAITKRHIGIGFRYLENNVERAAFTAVPKVISEGIEINFHKNHKGGQTDSKTIAAKILVDGEPELMAVVVRYVENEHKYKAHKVYMPDGTVIDIEKTGLAPVAAAEAADTHNPVPNENITQKTEHVNMSTREAEDQGIKDLEKALAHPHVKFSMREPVEATKDGLVALHNLGEEQLMKVFRLGGFAMPSIAIIRAAMGHTAYGDISVLFGRETIDPKESRYNKVYGGDAWTPTYPSIEYKLNNKKLNKIMQKIRDMLPDVFNGASVNLVDLYEQNLGQNINRQKGEPNIAEAIGSEAKKWLRIAYMENTGKEIKYPSKQKELDAHRTFDNEQVIHIANILGRDIAEEAMKEGDPWHWANQHPEIVEQIRTELNNKWRESLQEDSRLRRLELYNEQNYSAASAEYMLRAINKYYNDGLSETVDIDALDKSLKETIDEEDFNKWVNNLFSGVIEKSGIRNNKEYYTNSGNPRSWEQLHDEETLDNVVRIMRDQEDKGENAFFGQSAIMARGTKDFKSIDEIRKNKEQLQELSEEEYSELRQNIGAQFTELMDELYDRKERNMFIARDRVIEAIADAVNTSNKTAANISRTMKEWGYNLTQEQAQRIADLMEQISNLPTKYFEAKPKRAVTLDEIKCVILPESASQELFNAMNERGIPYDTYDGTDEDRLAKLNSVENVQFSMREPELEVNRWMTGLSESSLRTEQERMLWKQYKEVNGSWELTKRFIRELTEQMRKLEAKENKTAMDTFEIQKLQGQIEKWEEKRNEYEEQILKVTSDKGYAAIMYRERNKMENLLNGRTEDEVRQTVDAMQAELDTVEKEMAARNAKLKELSERENVKLIRNQLNSAGLRRIAAKLKNDLGSELQNKEIENRLALLALKMKQGKVDSTEIMELADMLVGSMRPAYDDYVLSELRGMTIALNSSEQETLKNRGMNIRDLQRELTGTGIRVVAGGQNTIDKNWDELTTALPQLDPDANPGDMLWGPDADHKGLMDLVEDAIRQQKAMGPDSDQVAAMVLEAASDLVPEILNDEKSMKLIRESMEFIAEINQSTETLDNMEDLFNRLRKKNANTKATLGKLENKIVDAIEYTNELAKQHDVTAWKHERRVIIDQLKDKHTKEILEIQTKYREKIAKDKKARDLMGDNNALRREIHRNISKYRRLIVNETDRENVPEAYKPLAREMLMKLIRHDLAADRKITVIDEERLADAFHFLSGMNARDGKFGLEDLNMLPEDIREEVADALANIEDGIRQYDADPKGKDIIENLKTYKDGLEQVAEAVNLITNVINKARSISYMDRERRLDDEAARVIRDMRRIKKELAGRGSKSANAVKRSVFYGNMTPVYFFKNLKNAGISDQWEEFEAAENKNGLELTKAKAFFDKVAEDCHYKSWDLDKEFTVKFNGFPVKITTEQIMALYATWQREKMIGPEESHHLETGGVILEDSGKDKGKPRMERKQQKARKVKDGDMAAILQLLTNEQKQYVHKVVGYLSKEMSDLGNEASMRMYGIKKYNEKWYFPFKVWDGVLSARSDKGITGKDENRAAHKGWSKRRKNNAGNALVIGNFTDTAVKHVVEMINYNTFAPAIENLNKIMNYQTVEVDQNQEEERRNIRVMFQEAYGTEALRYMEDWMRDLQGGVTQDQRKTLRDRQISLFKKIAVAGSLSVTLQQPLSYIRAAMMINPKYLAGALSPQYWKGSYQEMLDHSGVAVIKQMGRFDMNFGQSAQDWIMPKAKPNAYEKISDVLTAAPQAADTMTWTRMWSAVKMEQHAEHPDMDIQSEEFLNLVGKRFNEVMRRTQVYDSTLTKSSNMRSQALSMKLITSFMAEPTLSLNVLADAVANVKEKGGKATLAKACATHLLSAVLQAAVKGFMGAGRSPDEKKTAAENLLNKILYNLMSEANPVSLIPGYSDLVEVLKNGELKDDALGVLGKLKSIYTTAQNMLNPDKSKGPWRDVEDTLGQFVQLFSNIPLKNLMRDARAMYNWATGSKFADRDSSGAVVKYQTKETLMNGDNLLGVINSWLGDAGYKSTNKAYYSRMYNAMSGGNEAEAEGIREYLELAKGQGKDKIEAGLRTAAREDDSKTPAEISQWMIDNDLLDGTSSITTQYKKGEITREDAEKLYKAADPKMTGNDIFWKLDQMDYEKETGETETGYYYRLRDAITKNKAEEIKAAIKTLMEHGITKEKIKDKLSDWKAEYMAGDSAKKIQIRDAITKAYKAAGYTVEDANKTIERWNKEAKKAEPEKKDKNDTTGRWGRGNIDLNNRKVVENDDGTISTERSFSVNIDGKEVLLPTVIDGKIVSEEEAIRHYEQTGQYLGKFNTVKEAEEYAEKLHNRQDWYYNQ